MELADIVGSITRHWKVSVGLFVGALLVLAIFLVTRNEVLPETRFQASVLVLIPAPDDTGARPEGVPPILLQGQVTLANSSTTREAASAKAKLTDDEAADVEYSSSQNETLDIITLSVKARSEGVAERTADAYSAAYISARSKTVGSGARSRQSSLRSAVRIYRDRLAAVEDELRRLGVEIPEDAPSSSPGTATTTTTSPEAVPEDAALLLAQRNSLRASISSSQKSYGTAEIQSLTPTSYASIVERPPAKRLTPPAPSPVIPAAVALGVGLLLALVVPVLMDRLDHTVRDPKTATGLFDAPVLTTLPPLRSVDREFLAKVGSEQDQAYRSLAARSVATDRLPRSIVVTSPTGDAQDPVAANFAASLADLGLSVVLVATSASQDWFAEEGASQPHSLPEFLADAHSGVAATEVGAKLATSGSENLFLIPWGDTDGQAMTFDGLPPLLAIFEGLGIDITIFAGPPLLDDPTTTILAWTTRSVLWAVEVGEITQADAQEAASRIELAGVVPFGIAMIGAPA